MISGHFWNFFTQIVVGDRVSVSKIGNSRRCPEASAPKIELLRQLPEQATGQGGRCARLIKEQL